MGAQASAQASRPLARSMILIGGCELKLERNPIGKIEKVSVDEDGCLKQEVGEEINPLSIPVRSPAVHHFGDKFFVIGGCRGPRDHIGDV